jgi:endoglucanase
MWGRLPVIKLAGNPSGLAIGPAAIKNQFLKQVADAITQAGNDPWGFGNFWNGDTTSHGAGISVMASQAHYLTNSTYSQRWLASILGANAWGSSAMVPPFRTALLRRARLWGNIRIAGWNA